MLLQDDALEEIAALGEKAKPLEVCGLLLPTPWRGSWVIPVENTADEPETAFSFSSHELQVALKDWLPANALTTSPTDLILWHTHPGGGVGPSRIDMKNKVEGMTHLVVALTDDGAVPMFY